MKCLSIFKCVYNLAAEFSHYKWGLLPSLSASEVCFHSPPYPCTLVH